MLSYSHQDVPVCLSYLINCPSTSLPCPDFPFLVFIQCPGRTMIWRKRAGFRFKAGKFFCNAVKKINTCPLAITQIIPLSVFKNSGNRIATDRSSIVGIKLVSCKIIAIVFTQPVISSKPKKAFTILHTANSRVIRKSLFCCNVLKPQLLVWAYPSKQTFNKKYNIKPTL